MMPQPNVSSLHASLCRGVGPDVWSSQGKDSTLPSSPVVHHRAPALVQAEGGECLHVRGAAVATCTHIATRRSMVQDGTVILPVLRPRSKPPLWRTALCHASYTAVNITEARTALPSECAVCKQGLGP